MRFTGKFVATLSAALAILIVVGVLSYRKLLQETSNQQWVNHTHSVLETLDSVDFDVTNAETSQRGFLITGDGQFLQLYSQARTQLDAELDSVEDLTVDNPEQEAALSNLRVLIAEKTNEMQNRIGLRQEAGLQAASDAMEQGHVQETALQVRTAISNMKNTENKLLDERTRAAERGSRTVEKLIILGNLVAFVFLFSGGMIIRNEFVKRVAAEQVALKQGRELAASNKELEAFCYSVSHDLRAPLRGIDGFSQALIEDYGNQLDEQGRNYLIRVRAGTQRMGMLIDDLLNLSRLTRAELQRGTVNLSSVANLVAKDIGSLQAGRKVEVNIAPNLTANADPRLIRIVFENLLGNAWKFTSKAPHPRIEVGSAPHNGSPAYFVKDNGAGFNPEYASRLFGAFQRLHRADEFPGTGMDWPRYSALFTGMVAKSGPRATPGRAPLSISRWTLAITWRHDMHDKVILLVEDNPDDEALTLRALKKNNITNQVVVARDGAEALDYLFSTGTQAGKSWSDMFQVVLLDLKLPKIDGLEVLRRLRSDERTKRLPVVILTTSNEELDRAHGYDLGANSYVRKPVEFIEFTEAVRQLGMYWLLLNEGAPRPRAAA